MALYTLVVVALYPAFKHSTSLDKLVKNDATAAALFGVTGPLSSSGGWLNGNIYANFFPLIMLLLTIGYGAASLAGQDEDGTLCLIATLPLRRTAIVAQKAAAMAVQAVVLAAAVAVCVVIGRSFELTITLGNVAASLRGRRSDGPRLRPPHHGRRRSHRQTGTALGVGTALAAASYLISSLAPVVSWIRPGEVRVALLLVGRQQPDQQAASASRDYAVLIAVGLCALYAPSIAFRRLDLH